MTIVGLQPEEGNVFPAFAAGRREYLPGIFNASLVDEVLDIHQRDAESTPCAPVRQLAARLPEARGNLVRSSAFGPEGFSGAFNSPRKSSRDCTVLSVCAINACKKQVGAFDGHRFSERPVA